MSTTKRPPDASDVASKWRLRREVFPPRPTAQAAAVLLAGSTLASFAVVVTAMGIAATASSERPPAAPAIVHIIHSGDTRPGVTLPAMENAVTPASEVDLLPGAEASLLTELDGKVYMQLETAPEKLLDADRFALIGDVDAPLGAVAAVELAEVPERLAAWRDRDVLVGDSCAASVKGFAVVSPMLGDVLYLPLETWEPEEIHVIRGLLEYGETILAAELDGCAGHTTTDDGAPALARDAALSPLAAADRVEAPDLKAAASAHLFASEAAAEAQGAHAELRPDAGMWWELDVAELDAEVLRHPHTGELWVSVNARAEEGCGYADINLWGLYRVDAAGELEPVAVYELDFGTRLHGAFDLSDNGELAWVASRGFGESAIYAFDGEVLAHLEIPFFGCRC